MHTLSLLFLILTAGLFAGCSRRGQGYLEDLISMESPEYRDKKVSDKTMEDLRKGIERYRAEVDRRVSAAENLGVYYKMLAVEYMEKNMYPLALDNLAKAIEIFPENPVLFHLAGACAARVGKSKVSETEQVAWFQKSEAYYKRALELDPGYIDALYGLSVLLTFELQNPEEAEPLLKKVLERQSKNIDALFVLARVYYMTGRYEAAIETYGTIAGTATASEQKRQAQENKKKIEDELY